MSTTYLQPEEQEASAGMRRVETDGGSARQCRTPAPASTVCRACNREFFARSLPIHQKTCFQKNAFVELVCAKCHAGVRSGVFHEHEQSCTGPAAVATLSSVESAPQEEEELNSPDADGRVRCKKCGRGFAEVVTISLQQHKQPHKPSARESQACASRSYDFGRHFSEDKPDENVRERDKKRFDIVLRDAPLHSHGLGPPHSLATSNRFSNGHSARSAHLAASNATSTANPLATSRHMTTAPHW